MTTLPQTTTIRLPRPAGQGSLAIGNQPQGIAYAGGGTGLHMTGGDVMRILRTNLWLIIALVILGGIVGYVLNGFLARYYSRYTATGYIQISASSFMPDMFTKTMQPMMDNSTLGVDQKTQAQLLRGESLFSEVLQDPESEIRRTEWFKEINGDARLAKRGLRENYSVTPLPESRLLAVSFSDKHPKDCRTVIEALVNKHLENQRKLTQNRTQERSVQLNNLKTKYQFQLRNLEQELRDKVLRLNIDGMGVAGRVGTKENELFELSEQMFALVREAGQAKGGLDSTMNQLRQGIDPPKVKAEVDHDLELLGLQNTLRGYEISADDFKPLGSENKQTKSFKERKDKIQRIYDEMRATKIASGTAELVEALQGQVASNEAALKDLDERTGKVKQELADLNFVMNDYLTKKDEQNTTNQLLKEVTQALDVISQVNEKTEALAGLQWAGKPETPDSPSFPKLPVTLGLAIATGLALGVGIAFLREVLDTSVRSPRDIARVGQLNMLGVIPHEADDPQAEGAPLPLVISHAPHSMLAESFRQVRTRLQHAASLDSTRSILITSPGPGDGKSTVACNLAAGLALNGRKILLVDANFRRPELHKIFSVGNENGFSNVLNSIGNFESAITQTEVPNLDLLPSGPRPGNAAELLESQLLIDFIERALEEYDHVIFDSGPMLIVSETTALAPRVDGVVTVVKARKNSRGLLQRMRDALRQVKAEHLGVILNGVRAQAGGYYNRNMKTYYAYQEDAAA